MQGTGFIKVKDAVGGFSNGNCRGFNPPREEGFAACIKCSKRHLVQTDCKGLDFVCDKCKDLKNKSS